MRRILATGGCFAAILVVVLVQAIGSGSGHGVAGRLFANPRAAALQRPLLFEPNAGRTRAGVDFIATGAGYRLWLAGREAVMAVGGGKHRTLVRTTFTNGRDVRAIGQKPTRTVVNSYVGARSSWRTGLPTFGQVRYRGLYPGIDLVYRGSGPSVEYDLHLKPGAQPGQIAIAFSRGAHLSLDPLGNLRIRTKAGTMMQKRPAAFQTVNGKHTPVHASFTLAGQTVRLRVGAHIRTRPLVIDPQIVYSTYVGGTGADDAEGIAVDPDGAVYVTGDTNSADIPPYPTTPDAGSDDAFVLKLDPSGTGRPYLTYLGGSDLDIGNAIAVGPGNTAYVTGLTGSTDYPTSDSPYQTAQGGTDGFLTKLDSTGAIAFSTYIGGSALDQDYGVAVDSSGNSVVVGDTSSDDIGTSSSTADEVVQNSQPGGEDDGYVISFDDAGARRWATYLGGSTGQDKAEAVALDADGNVYVTGWTASTDFPHTAGSPHGGSDAFLTKLNPTATAVTWSAYLGGDNIDQAFAIAVAHGEVVIVGRTTSTNFAGSATAGGSDGFVMKWHSDGGVMFGRHIGSGGFDDAQGVTMDQYGNVYVTGLAGDASTFPTTDGIGDAQTAGQGSQAYVAKLGFDDGAANYAFTIGGFGQENAEAIAIDSENSVYVAGVTSSKDFPTTPGAQTAPPPPPSGPTPADAFVFKVSPRPITITRASQANPTTQSDQTFAFSTQDGGMQFECEVDGGAPARCSPPHPVTVTTDGEHSFGVRARQAATDTPATESFTTVKWTLDRVAPNDFAVRTPAPDATGLGQQPTFTWDAATDATSGVKTYRVLVDGHAVVEVGSAACSGGVCSAAAGSDLSIGGHKWHVDAIDGAGNMRSSAERAFTVVVPPTAKLTASPDPALVGTPVTFDASGSADSVHTIAKYEWDLNGDGGFETDTGTTATTMKIFLQPGTFTVGVRVTDQTGAQAMATTAVRVNTLVTAAQLGVTINNGALYTRDRHVTLSLKFPATTSQLLISNDGGFLAPTTFTPAAQVPWTLDVAGPERLPKIVYVRFLNGPIVSETHTDDIILDTTPPVVSQASVASAARASSVAIAAKAKTKRWTVKLKAKDSNSGVDKVQITSNKRKPGKLLAYKTKLKVTSKRRPKVARAQDRAGNFSHWKKIP